MDNLLHRDSLGGFDAVRSNSQALKLPPIHANIGTTVYYRKKLYKLIDAMNVSVMHWLEAAYKANEPEMAKDELPANVLKRVLKRLSKQWQKQFDEQAPKLAKFFAQSASKRSSKQLERILREGGMSIRFRMSASMRDVMNASIAEQVGLIRSIPQKYFTDIEGLVMRSVIHGRDLEYLTKELQKRYGVTRRRAKFIARDQNNKATAAMVRVRQQELGVERAIWVHSGGGKEPRPSHVANSGKSYDVKKGWYDPALKKYIFPGEEPNCRCVSRAIVPGVKIWSQS